MERKKRATPKSAALKDRSVKTLPRVPRTLDRLNDRRLLPTLGLCDRDELTGPGVATDFELDVLGCFLSHREAP